MPCSECYCVLHNVSAHWVKRLIRDIKMPSFLFIKGYAYSKSFVGLTIQTTTFVYRFMEVNPSGSNILWKECLVCFERME